MATRASAAVTPLSEPSRGPLQVLGGRGRNREVKGKTRVEEFRIAGCRISWQSMRRRRRFLTLPRFSSSSTSAVVGRSKGNQQNSKLCNVLHGTQRWRWHCPLVCICRIWPNLGRELAVGNLPAGVSQAVRPHHTSSRTDSAWHPLGLELQSGTGFLSS